MHYKKIMLSCLCMHFYAFSGDYQLLEAPESCPKVNTFNIANYIQSFAFNKDEQQFTTGSYDQAKVWDINGQTFTKCTHTFKTQPCYFNNVHFVSNELLLTAADNGDAVLRNLTTQAHETFKHPQEEAPLALPAKEDSPHVLPSVYSAQANPDKTDIVSATKGYAALWDINTGMRKHKLKHDDKKVIAAMFNFDGSQVATAAENFVHLWDAKTGNHIASFENKDTVKSISFAPDGLSVIAAVGNMAKIWSVRKSKIMDEIEVDELETKDSAYDNNVTGVEYHPNGKHLLTTSFDRTVPWYQWSGLRPRGRFYPKAKIWDINTKECLHTLEDQDSPHSLKFAQFTPSGDNIATQRRTWKTVIDLYNIRSIIDKK